MELVLIETGDAMSPLFDRSMRAPRFHVRLRGSCWIVTDEVPRDFIRGIAAACPAGVGRLVLALLLVLGASAAGESFVTTKAPGGTAASHGIFAVYGHNLGDGTPNYITEDLLLLSYGMIRVDVAHAKERSGSLPRVRELVERLANAVDADGGNAAQANLDFVAVLRALLDGQSVPKGKRNDQRAQRELDLVLAAEGITSSPLWGRPVDYSQFRPRGLYADDGQLAGYFRAVRYAGAALFPAQASKATGVSRRQARRASQQAWGLADIIEGNAELAALYHAFLDELTWQYGPPDDLTNAELLAVPPQPARTFGKRLLAYAREHGAQPRIVGEVVDRSKLERGVTIADALTGWRLLPQRRTPESEAFQALVFDSTGKYRPPQEQGIDHAVPTTLTLIDGQPVKGFPLLAELMCLWGSASSCDAIVEQREDRFEGYAEAADRARRALASAQGLAALHRSLIVSSLRSCHEHCEDRLTAMRAFWTWQRYAAALYAKQSYTPTGKGLALNPPRRPGARVQPSLGLYMGLARVVEGHRRHTPHPSWDAFAEILDRLIEVAARHDLLTAADEAFLNNLDADLKALAGGPDAPIIVDVHSNPARGQALYEATGLARVVDEGNRPWAPGAKARGARFSQCEFFGPMDNRLTDAEWRQRLPRPAAGNESPFFAGQPCPDADGES